METKYHWLFSGQVRTAHKNGTQHSYPFNVMVVTDEIKIRRVDLAAAQEAMARRFVGECPQIPGFSIVDCYIEGFHLMGDMSSEDFNAGFEQAVQASGGMN